MNRLARLLLASVLGVAVVPAEAGDTQRHRNGDWLLTCDNQGGCSIIGVPAVATPPMQVRAVFLADRATGEGSHWRVRWLFLGPTVAPLDRPAEPLALIGIPLRAIGPGPSLPIGPLTALASPIEPEAAVGADHLSLLSSGAAIQVSAGNAAFAEIPHGRLAALLALADQIQREWQPAEGAGPEDSIWRWTDILPLSEGERDEGIDRLPGCSRAGGLEMAMRAGRDTLLWLIRCPDGNRLLRQSGDVLQDITLPERLRWVMPGQLRIDEDGLLLLTEFAASDRSCGAQWRYGWTMDDELTLVEVTEMPLCRGVVAPYWPASYRFDHYRFIGTGEH